MSNLLLTNSLTKKKEIFKPINQNKISMYACGPTVYDSPHVGNARSLVVFDVLFRVLKFIYGSKVNYVRNITDVDDKIIEASKQKNKNIKEITNEITKIFHQNCESLNCLKPTVEPKATDHIKEMITMSLSLIEKGFAYVNQGHVYFDINSFKDYGKLSNKNLDELKSGSRIEVSDLKKHPMDFVLWKPSKDIEDLGWESPWGRGRPGWHLECSVMSEKYLGKHFDIHGGGLDLIFPHHENEIAQSCSNNNSKSFANYWIHNGFVTINNEKMSKSLGNIITISEAVSKFSGQVVRLALLSAHYSQPLDWNDQLLRNQESVLNKWYSLYTDVKENNFDIDEILLDDLNTPGFIAKIHELYNSASKGDNEKKIKFNQACRLLGLFNVSKNEWENFKKKKIKVSEKYIMEKIDARSKAKDKGDFTLADKIREELLSNGILIEDQKDKTIWKYK